MGKEAEHKSESEPAQIFAEGSATADLNWFRWHGSSLS
jgi:hypothetical protein